MVLSNKIQGRCLCGDIKFSVDNSFDQLYFCHCAQCKQITGSAFAANLFIRKESLSWLDGENKIRVYKDPQRGFTKYF